MNTKGIKFLAVLAVLAMAFAVFAVVSDTEQNDAAIPTEVTTVTTESAFRTAITGASDFNIKLGANLVVDSSASAYLVKSNGIIDFAGYTLTVSVALTSVTLTDTSITLTKNDNGLQSIIVSESKNLTLKDSSTDANGGIVNSYGTNNAAAVLFNAPGAVMTIDSGVYKVDNGDDEFGSVDTTGHKYWYTVKNLGTMTINGGKIMGMNHYWGTGGSDASSVLVNGWDQITEGWKTASLTINGGEISYGMYTKGDYNAVTTINGGTFKDGLAYSLLNTDVTVIEKATFSGTNSGFYNWTGGESNKDFAEGKLTINSDLTVAGVVKNFATTTINGTITSTATINNAATIINNGKIIVNGGAIINNSADSKITSSGTGYINTSVTFTSVTSGIRIDAGVVEKQYIKFVGENADNKSDRFIQIGPQETGGPQAATFQNNTVDLGKNNGGAYVYAGHGYDMKVLNNTFKGTGSTSKVSYALFVATWQNPSYKILSTETLATISGNDFTDVTMRVNCEPVRLATGVYTDASGLITIGSADDKDKKYNIELGKTDGSLTFVQSIYEIKGDLAVDAITFYSESVELKIADGVKLTNNGTIVNKGTITCTGTASIVGDGVLKNYKLLVSGMTAANNHTTLCTVESYSHSEWKNTSDEFYVSYVGSGNAAVVTVPADSGDNAFKVISSKQTMTSAGTAISSATFDVFGAITINTGAWIDNTYTDKVTVHKDGVITLGAATTVGENDVVTFEDGAKIVAKSSTPELLTVSGKVVYADPSQIYVNTKITEGKGSVEVAGEGGSSEEEVVVVPDSEIPSGKIDQSVFDDNPGADVIVTTVEVTEATVPAGKTVVINAAPKDDAVLNVAAENSEVTVRTSTPATFSVNTGAGIIKLSGVTGTFNFYKGSIVVEAKEWTGGDMVLEDGDVLKMSGTVKEDVSITVKAGGKATVIIEDEEGKELSIDEGKTLTIGEKVSVTIDGKLIGKGTMDVAEKVTLNGTLGADATLKAAENVDVYGTVKGTIDNAKKVIAHEKSNINDYTAITDDSKLEGKDADGGIWKYDGTDTLTIIGYSGNYNFAKFKDTLETIEISGDSKVTYKLPKEYTAGSIFGADSLTAISTDDTATLEIIVDYSNVSYEEIQKANVVISAGDSFTLNGVGITITAKGSNDKWTDTSKIKLTAIQMLNGTGKDELTMYKASLKIDAFSAYESNFVIGLIMFDMDTGVEVDIKNSHVEVLSAGTGIIIIGEATIDSSIIYVAGSEIVLIADDVEVLNSDVDVIGKAAVGSIKLDNQSDVLVSDVLSVGSFELTKDSVLSVNDFALLTEGTVKKGVLSITGDALIAGTLTNKDIVNNSGTVAVYGTFDNQATLNNSGNFYVFAKESDKKGTNNSISVTDDAASSDSKVKVQQITIQTADMNADGTVDITAYIDFVTKTGAIGHDELKEGTKLFEGTMTFTDLVKEDERYYTLELTNGTATVKVTFKKLDKDPGAEIGKSYTIDVAGKITKAGEPDVDYDLEPNASKKAVDDKTVTNKFAVKSDADLKTNADSMIVNEGVMVIYASKTATLAGTFVGDLTTYLDKITVGKFGGDLTTSGAVDVNGTFVGDITAKGAIEVKPEKVFTGDMITEGAVTINGTVLGGIETKDSVVINATGIVTGDIEVTVGTTGKTFTVAGKFAGDLIFNSEYLAKSTDKEGEETVETSVMEIVADMTTTEKTFVITLGASKNATSSAAGEAGVMSLTTLNAPAKTKSVSFVLKQGTLKVGSVTLPERYELVIEKDTTFEVTKGSTFDVKAAALKVSKDATANFETGSGIADKYGKVTYIMTFAIEGGAYTIYSDVAYALSNCEEGQELTLGSNAKINSNVDVKKGVNIIVSDKVTLDFDSYALTMGENAKITLQGTGKVTFTKSGSVTDDKDKEYEFYKVTGTIVYEGNAVEFSGVRFTADSTVVGVAATSTAVAKISTTLLYNEGTATITAGTGTGAITLGNDAYYLTKEDAKTEDVDRKTTVYATFIIGSDAVFDAVSISDAFMSVKYKEDGDDLVIDKIRLMPTIVGVEGTLNLTATTTTVKGVYAGLGKITLAAGKELTFAKSAEKVKGDNITVPGSISAKIVDTTDDENGYVLNLVSPMDNEALSLKATTQKVGTETINVMTISGNVGIGIVTGTTEAFLKGVVLEDEASLIADSAYIIGPSTAKGVLAAKDIYMKEGTATSEFSTLDYQVTFEQGEYTAYTYFANVDFEEVSDIELTDSYNLSALVKAGTDKLDLTGYDVNIVIADGKKLTVDIPLIIGTPIDSFGAAGSSITGKVIIKASADEPALVGTTPVYRYIVAYTDVDLSGAEIYQNDGKTAAVYSMLLIDDIVYATIFANDGTYNKDAGAGKVQFGAGMGLALADKTLIPEIEGYIFTKWSNLNDDPNAAVGETTAYANAKAISVTVIVKFAEGVSYYLDGVEFAIYDTPTKVDYNSVFTAKINNTAKYEGTPLINGKNSFIVTEDATLTVTGVNPIPVPPQPEPEPVVGDSGLSLTDILLIVLVVLIAIMVVILVLRLNRS